LGRKNKSFLLGTADTMNIALTDENPTKAVLVAAILAKQAENAASEGDDAS
jgi:hypothetical protein